MNEYLAKISKESVEALKEIAKENNIPESLVLNLSDGIKMMKVLFHQFMKACNQNENIVDEITKKVIQVHTEEQIKVNIGKVYNEIIAQLINADNDNKSEENDA